MIWYLMLEFAACSELIVIWFVFDMYGDREQSICCSLMKLYRSFSTVSGKHLEFLACAACYLLIRGLCCFASLATSVMTWSAERGSEMFRGDGLFGFAA